MKRFLMYVVVLIAILFVGFTTYYFARNNEEIYLDIAQDGTIYLNEGDTVKMPLTKIHANSDTTYKVTISKGGEQYISYDENTETFTALSGGTCDITVTCSNSNFGPFKFGIAIGNGKSSETPLHIWTAEQLAQIGKNTQFASDLYYMIVEDLYLDTYNNGNWIPIGTETEPFRGTIDGLNKVIYGLNINTNMSNAGLFGVIGKDAKVENIQIANAKISGSFNNAGFIAAINSGFIGRCSVKNSVLDIVWSNTNAGGIVGKNMTIDARARVDMCESYIDITANAESATVGGLIGLNVGGVLFNSKSEIYNANISDNVIFGGIIGHDTYFYGELYKNSVVKNTYTVVDNSNLGSKSYIMIGKSNMTDYILTQPTYVSNYCASSMQTLNNKIVEVVGYSSFNLDGLKQVSKNDLANKKTFIGWNFGEAKDGVWAVKDDIDNNEFSNIYAYINYEGATSYEQLGIYDIGQEIKTAEELRTALEYIRANPETEATFEIVSNMTLDLQGATFEPIEEFRGKLFTSKEVKICNFTVEGNKYGGIFERIVGVEALVKGITFENINLINNVNSGIVAGINDGGTIENIKIEKVSIKGGTSGNANTGSIVGVNYGTIKNCNVIGTKITDKESIYEGLFYLEFVVDNGNAGYIAGKNYGDITACDIIPGLNNAMTIQIRGDDPTNVGFVIGANYGNITSCRVYGPKIEGNPIATTYIGGISAINNGLVSNCYLTGCDIKVDYSEDKNNILHDNMTGGLVGDNSGTIKQSFIDQTSIKGNRIGGIVGNNNGTVEKCYIEGGVLNGDKVGGLSYSNSGYINNCFSNVSLSGIFNSSTSCGFTVTLPKKSALIEHCYSFPSFGGAGEAYAETMTAFRQGVGGNMKNNIFCYDKEKGYTAKVQCLLFNWKWFFVNFKTAECVSGTAEGMVDPGNPNANPPTDPQYDKVPYINYEALCKEMINNGFSILDWNIPYDNNSMKNIIMLIGLPENTINPILRFIPKPDENM